MTTETRMPGRLRRTIRRFRPIFLAPILAFVALSAWAFASPIGAGPDDDYHLVSIWCANGGSAECLPGAEDNTRVVPESFRQIACYAQVESRSAECQTTVLSTLDDEPVELARGNFVGEYPPVYYATMRIFAGADIQVSALTMRLVNAALFVALATALAALLPPARRRTLLWGWLVTLVPLGMFLVPSNNPSGWAITGVGTAFLALLGWFESTGRRRWALAALFVVGIVMSAGARGDAAVYAVGATVSATLIAFPAVRTWWRSAWLPVLGIVIAVVLYNMAGQRGVVNSGFGGGTATLPIPGEGGEEAVLRGLPLAAYNLLMLPLLWTGVWGTWGLGWLDTQLPAIVAWAAVSAFVVVAFAGLGRLNWRKAITIAGVLLVLIALPVHVLTTGGDKVGANLQPRYLLPLIVLFAMVVLTDTARTGFRYTRLQTFTIFAALAVANLVAIQVNIRRYVTGADQQGFNLDDGAEWWWPGLPVGPTAVWVIGALAYAGLLAVLWPQLRRSLAVVVD
jgi:hypothetical protein